jgi:hypothetical protein
MDDAERLQVWLTTYEPSVIVEMNRERIVMRPARPLLASFEVETPRSDDLYMDLDAALRQLVSTTS